jgi:hypothetical protein
MNMGEHLSSQTLDLLSLSALARPEGDKARAHLSDCHTCQQRWEELEGDRARFSKFVLPRTLAAVQARAAPGALWTRLQRRWALWVPLVGLATAAALVLVVVAPSVVEPSYQLKGGGRLEVVAQKGTLQLTVGEETVLKEGDRIRFLVEPAGAPFVLVASRDGAGDVTIYHPFGGSASAPAGEGFHELPGSIELDGAGGRETIFAVFSERPVQADAVRAALQEGVALSSLPSVVEVVETRFLKEGP